MNTPEKPVVASTELFDRCAETKLFRDGVIQIHCKLGLWSVQGRDARHTRREAMHYWIQYFEDGEYNDLLSNPSRQTSAARKEP